MEYKRIAKGITESTECLWELINCIRHNIVHDPAEAQLCAANLACYLQTYKESGLDTINQAHIWFAEQVLEAYHDICEAFD